MAGSDRPEPVAMFMFTFVMFMFIMAASRSVAGDLAVLRSALCSSFTPGHPPFHHTHSAKQPRRGARSLCVLGCTVRKTCRTATFGSWDGQDLCSAQVAAAHKSLVGN